MDVPNLNAEPLFEPTSGELVAGNEDLATEILINLPATSLARSMWVSKQWLSFISNPRFIQRHTLLYPPSLSGLFLVPKLVGQRHKIYYVSLISSKQNISSVAFRNSRDVQILQSCNGLLLCHSGWSYYVGNPTTRCFRVLPTCVYMNKEYELSLAFDPLTSLTYKVVCVQWLNMVHTLFRIAIYSSETRLWSLFDEHVSATNGVDFKSGVFCNNAIHWPNGTSTGMFLNLKTLVLREMPQPPRREEEQRCHLKYFGKSQGCLFCVTSHTLLHRYEVYQMEEDYSGWCLRFELNLNMLASKFPAMVRIQHVGTHPWFQVHDYECDVLSIVHAQSDKDVELVLSIPGEIVIFNLKKNSFVHIHDPVFRPSNVSIWDKKYLAYECFETLSLV